MNWTVPGLSALLLLAGCSPALDWRTVPLEGARVTALLPCKPEHAVRLVALGGEGAPPVDLALTGCDADGATFAVSHAAWAAPQEAGAQLARWRAAVQARMQAGPALAEQPFAPAGALALPQSVRVALQGQRADGTPVYAQAVWFARLEGAQARLIHAVVYSAAPRPDVADTFFAGLSLP